jgi:hypothetical protein
MKQRTFFIVLALIINKKQGFRELYGAGDHEEVHVGVVLKG